MVIKKLSGISVLLEPRRIDEHSLGAFGANFANTV
jgi:hypothetical protein